MLPAPSDCIVVGPVNAVVAGHGMGTKTENIQGGPKITSQTIFLNSVFFIHRHLYVIFMPHILGDISQRCDIQSASGRSNLFQSI